MLRFAPSLARELRIDDLHVALINALVAKQRGEGLILRFDDSDRARAAEGREEATRLILEKFAFQPDRTFYRSEHLGHYQRLAVQLLERGKAFLCICREEDLHKERETAEAQKRPYRYSGHCLRMDADDLRKIREEKIPYTIRLRKPEAPLVFADLIHGRLCAEPGEVDHFVILRSDGTPTRDFACACDDMLGGISLVIEREEHIAGTFRQRQVHHALGYESTIEYAHLPALLDTEGRKLSTETGSVRKLLEEGFLPDAIINALLRLGTEPPTEVFTLPEAVEWFDLTKLSPSPTRFDREELRRINREHLRRMDDLTLSRLFRFADAEIGKLAKLYLDEAATIGEIDTRIRAIFAPKKCEGEAEETLRALSALILEAPMEAPIYDSFDRLESYLAEKSGLESERLSSALRRLMTGTEHGPELSDIYTHIKPYLTEVVRCQP